MIRNQEVASMLEKIADLLETKGESTYRIGAYRTAARNIATLPHDIADDWQHGHLEDIPGVGTSIAGKIDEFLRTGRLGYLEDLQRQVAPGLASLLEVPGLGPRRIKTMHDALGISNLSELERAARQHRLTSLPGFGPKVEANILREIDRLSSRTRRLPLGVALPIAEEVVSLLSAHPAIVNLGVAGSIRRRRDTIGDVDIVAATDQPVTVIDAFTTLSVVRDVLEKGPTRASVLVGDNLQIDMRAIPPNTYGAALMYFTGSKEHNIALREIALQRGLRLNEYGLFDEQTGRRIAGLTEEETYAALGMPWIPPELRENRGEIEAALAGRLPCLITEQDLRGDLHVHTDWSDGVDTLEDMVAAARQRGYEYVVISDHSRGLGIARGLSVERMRAQRKLIENLNRRMSPFRVLHGVEVNIRRDGSLDYSSEILREFDVVTASVHGSFDQSEEKMTARVLAALRDPAVHILGHPHGRLLGKREGYALDLDAVILAARDLGVALEINSQPDRLDLDDLSARKAHEAGVLLAIDTDAHAVAQLGLISYGVSVARRAWAESTNVLNALPIEKLLAWLRHRRNAGTEHPSGLTVA
jgi:DNA polymerase (family 10)